MKVLANQTRDLKTALQYSVTQNTQAKNYMFNCPENFHQTMMLQKAQFTKIDAVFIPSLYTDNFAGFTGYKLNRNDLER